MSKKMIIRTNRQWRETIQGYELTEKERTDFDYVEDIESHSFIRYHGNIIDPGEIFAITSNMRLHAENDFTDWHGYQSDSYFSGIVIRYSDDCERYQIGTYCC